MSKINVLDEITINKIAAGEVIERPVSVVKELVENSLDAGAARIDVEVQNGGKVKILVKDNGIGMNKDDVLLAIQRHATSKINSAQDLFAIKTMGFRGEALPSIASISKTVVVSKRKDSPDSEPGIEVKLEGGKIVHTTPAPSSAGTTIIVEELFYNVPARLKFLKKDATELGQITSIMSKFVIGNPQVAFTLKSNGKTLIQSPGAENLSREAFLTAATVILGAKLVKKMKQFEFHSSFMRLRGFLCSPDETKVDRSGQFFYVNNRFIQSFALSKAVGEGLRDRIPRGRFPICILFLEINAEDIDVNVHPAKREIKFLKQSDIFSGVLSAVKNTFLKMDNSIQAVELVSKDPIIRMKAHQAQISAKNIEGQGSLIKTEELQAMINAQTSAIDSGYAETRERLFPVAQVNKTYIVALDGEDLVLIDQHVAQERIYYEKLKAESIKKEKTIQDLLIPETIELNPQQDQILKQEQEVLISIGFRWEDFGQQAILLRGVPQLISTQNPKQLFIDILDELLSSEKTFQKDKMQEEFFKVVACKASIKAGQVLTIQEMKQLVKDLEQTANPHTCPHGRPVIVAITKSELDKKFGR